MFVVDLEVIVGIIAIIIALLTHEMMIKQYGKIIKKIKPNRGKLSNKKFKKLELIFD